MSLRRRKIALLETALRGLSRAQKRLARVKDSVGPEIISQVDVSLLLADAVEKYEQGARDNADNVTANRAKQFVDYLVQFHDLKGTLAKYAFERGLMGYDGDAILAKLRGNPRPIVIEPERAVTVDDFEDDGDEEAMDEYQLGFEEEEE